MANVNAIRSLRALLNELRLANPTGNIKNSVAAKYILAQFRKYRTTDQQLCKAKEEMLYLQNTYLCYLQSARKTKSIQEEFHGKGERTVESTASLMGFKLPHEPK